MKVEFKGIRILLFGNRHTRNYLRGQLFSPHLSTLRWICQYFQSLVIFYPMGTPTQIALPTLTCMVLGPATTVATDTLLDTFLDFISASKRQTFKLALSFNKERLFLPIYKSSWTLLPYLAAINCLHSPTYVCDWVGWPKDWILLSGFLNNYWSKAHSTSEWVARYEFMIKPAASVSLINLGVPLNHRGYWSRKSSSDVH